MKEQIRTYKMMSEHNHHILLNVCDKARDVIEIYTLPTNFDDKRSKEGCLRALKKIVDDAEGVPFKEQKKYDYSKLSERLKQAYEDEQ